MNKGVIMDSLELINTKIKSIRYYLDVIEDMLNEEEDEKTLEGLSRILDNFNEEICKFI